MRFTKIILTLISVIALLVSCNEQNENKTETSTTTQVETTQYADTVSIDRAPITGETDINGKTYSYIYEFMRSDTLPIITGSSGKKYYDNICKLTITHNGNVVLTKTFTKKSFKKFISDEHYNSMILFGGNINVNKSDKKDKFYFVACITEPDEEGAKVEIDIAMTVDGRLSFSEFVESPMR
jgi:hypothetical protein